MQWGRNWRNLTERELGDLEFRLEAVQLAAVHGVAGAVALLNRRNPDRRVDAAVAEALVKDYEGAEVPVWHRRDVA